MRPCLVLEPSDDPNPEWGVVTAVATRAQARSGKDPKPLRMKEVTDKMSINKKDLIKMHEEDPALQKLKQLKELRPGRDMWSHMRSEEEFGAGYLEGRMTVETPVSRS